MDNGEPLQEYDDRRPEEDEYVPTCSRMTDEQQRQIRSWLTTQPPREIVETRNNLDFITWSVKWAIVRYAFPDASIRMGQRWETGDGYHLTVIITTAGVQHEGLGFEPRKSEKQVSAYSDSGYKAAYSDAVSRACALVGVGLLLYMDPPLSKALIHLLTGEVAQPEPKGFRQSVTPPQDDESGGMESQPELPKQTKATLIKRCTDAELRLAAMNEQRYDLAWRTQARVEHLGPEYVNTLVGAKLDDLEAYFDFLKEQYRREREEGEGRAHLDSMEQHP